MTLAWPFFPNLRRWRLAPLLACAVLLAGCNVRFGDPKSVLDDEAAVATALSAIRSNYRGPVRTVKLVIADDGLLLHAQDPLNSRQISEWRLERQQYMFFNWDRVSGPRMVDTMRRGAEQDERLFDLNEVDLTNWGKVADAAIERAALQGKGGIHTIEIARPGVLRPGSPGSAVRWSIEVRTPNETARIFANAKGEIVGANLNGTARMKGLTMYQRPELAVDAVADVMAQVGKEPILMKVSFYSSSIGFETNIRDDKFPLAGIRANSVYSWTYDGLQRTSGSPDTRSFFSNPEQPFGLGDVDWALLPKIVADARGALAMPNGRVTSINVTKPGDGIGTPVPLWSIDLEEDRERGSYVADPQGAVKKVSLPPSKRKPIDWLDNGVLAQSLGRVAADFGPGGQIVNVFFDKDGGRITAVDPRKPGTLMQALFRDDGLNRWGTPMFEQGQPFAASDLDALSADRLAALLERTRKELNMPDGAVRDITISRAGIGMKDRNKVAVALVVRTPRGRLGRVVQALDGTMGEVYEWPSSGSRP